MATLMELNETGARRRGHRTVRRARLSLTDDDDARRRCVQWMAEAGLEVRMDRIGNVHTTRPGPVPAVRA